MRRSTRRQYLVSLLILALLGLVAADGTAEAKRRGIAARIARARAALAARIARARAAKAARTAKTRRSKPGRIASARSAVAARIARARAAVAARIARARATRVPRTAKARAAIAAGFGKVRTAVTNALARVRRTAASLFAGKRWAPSRKLARTARAVTGARYWKVSLFDDFKGRPSNSARDKLCYDQMPTQCHIWSGAGSYRCDLAHLPESDATMIPPLRENMAAALATVDKTRNWMTQPLQAVKARYGQVLAERTKHLDKCTWTLYHMLNWMSTDYQGHHAARFDGMAVRVLPQGKGYLELSAVAAPISIPCPNGGTLVAAGRGKVPDACKVTGLASGIRLVPGVRYWIDSDPRWPGLYYAGVGGGCPHGGSGGRPNCQLVGFEKDLLQAGVSYALRGRDVVYLSTARDRCTGNVEYPNGGVRFKKIACQILNGGMMSNHSAPVMGEPSRGFTQKYGRFEVKLKIPRGEGAFPAAWLMPIKGAWPYSGGEIDIIEARDNADEAYQTYHHGKCYRRDTSGGETYIEALTFWKSGQEWPIDSNVCHAGSTSCVASYRTTTGATGRNPDGACADRFALRTYSSINVALGHTQKAKKLAPFHLQDTVYAVEWTPERLDYYVNGEHTHTVAVGSTPTTNYATGGGQAQLPASLAALAPHNFPRDPFYWILNHSTWVRPERRAGFQPQRLLIDYVKAYTACTTAADFCPCGGSFVAGTGCVLGGAAPRCGAGQPTPQILRTRSGSAYQSPCSLADVAKPSLGDKIATAAKALREKLARSLARLKSSLASAWRKVVSFFKNIKHWLDRFDKCVSKHVIPLAQRLGGEAVATARAELDTFWRDAAPVLAGMSAQDKHSALAGPWAELLSGFGQRFDEARGTGIATVRGWFSRKKNKDAAQPKFAAAFDAARAGFNQIAAASLAANTR